MSTTRERAALETLARLFGVDPTYTDATGHRREVATETLLAVLGALGAACERPADAPGAARERRAARREGRLEAVLVAWDGLLAPPSRAPGDAITLEDGSAGPPAGALLPPGVHELSGAEGAHAFVISAPRRATPAPGAHGGRGFGLLAPTYALRDARERSAGDLSALAVMADFASGNGADLVATLPLLAEFATADGAPHGQQPYAPISRLWWNEGYLDLDRLPELAAAGAAARVDAEAVGGRADLAGRASAIRPALALAAERLEARDSRRRRAYRRFAAARPELAAYAHFRAAVEVHGPDRTRWPTRPSRGAERLAFESAARRHAYAQWATDDALGEIASGLARCGAGLFLDFPVGCRPDGFDPFWSPDAHAVGASIGAPPDAFFTGGQDWGLAPPHPLGDRARGYPLLRAGLRAHMAHARVLRLDHVMGLSRLWWVPTGMDASAGAYVRYPREELLALVCLYARRHETLVVGEDLGTVETSLRRELGRRAIARTHVVCLTAERDARAALRPPPGSVAYVDVHDAATFAGWLGADDLRLAAALGVGGAGARRPADAARQRAVTALRAALGPRAASRRRADPRALLSLVLERLGSSRAAIVLVALEDLWGERRQHNLPGAGAAYPSFLERHARRIDELADDPVALELLARLAASRSRRHARRDRCGAGRGPGS